jgi:hypothetical protein
MTPTGRRGVFPLKVIGAEFSTGSMTLGIDWARLIAGNRSESSVVVATENDRDGLKFEVKTLSIIILSANIQRTMSEEHVAINQAESYLCAPDLCLCQDASTRIVR